MVVAYLSCQYQQVIPVFQKREIGQRLFMSLLYPRLQAYGCFFIGKEMYPASEGTSHSTEMLHPMRKTGFVFGFRRDGNDNSFDCMDWY